MEGKTSAPDAVVIAQDDETNLRIQAMLQGGRRHVDIRIWRRGPTGFSPSRTGVVVRAPDLDALQQGIRELLEASHDGQQVARVVWDSEDGRRLRAELEPFGTRFLARLGFWQRARDSWHPAGEDLVFAADRLRVVQRILDQFRPWLSEETPVEQPTQELEVPPERNGPDRWPAPGADWLTVENERVALHPRGYRITGSVAEGDGVHRVVLRQWKRQDSLWLPKPASLSLTALDLDKLLVTLAEVIDGREGDGGEVGGTVPLSDGSTLQVEVGSDGTPLRFIKPPAEEPCLLLPDGSAGKFGRLLVESWSLLIRTLSDRERQDLEAEDHVLEIPIEPSAEPELPAMLIGTNDTNLEALSQPAEDEDRVAEESEQAIPLGEFHMGHHRVALTLQDRSRLRLAWEERWIDIPVQELEALLEQLRKLYYDALRGYRGGAVLLDEPSSLTANVQNIGMSLYCTLQTGRDGKTTSLSFPASEVPAFLDAAGAALACQ